MDNFIYDNFSDVYAFRAAIQTRPDNGKAKHASREGDRDFAGMPYDKAVEALTDGLPEATAPSGEMFGTDRMVEALNSCPDSSPEAILGTVRNAVDAFVGDAEQFDDLTMMCLQYKG